MSISWPLTGAPTAIAVFVAMLLMASAPPGGTTLYVDDDNCPGPGSGTQKDPYCSIQAAIVSAAMEGDEIIVAPGTYFETIDFMGKAVWLHSSDGAEVTIIDAQQTGSVLTCHSGEGSDTVLEGFTITGGTGTWFEKYPGEFAFVGGGMFNTGGSGPTVTNCTFSGNSAEIGGGMANDTDSSPAVTNCTFSGNSAYGDRGSGGGMSNRNNNFVVTNCVFSGNFAAIFGGGMDYDNSSPTITNCTFSGNSTDGSGGGMAFYGTSSPTITNCTFTGNVANSAGAMYSEEADPTVLNCILWGNSPDEVVAVDGSVTNFGYSNVQGGGFPGSGNIDDDPLFVDPDGPDDIPGTEDDDLRLSPGSPCIDAGDNTAVPVDIMTDLDGNPRFVDDPDAVDSGNGDPPIVDMGAYELQRVGCPGDTDGDGLVNVDDLTAVILDWGTDGSQFNGDVDGSGTVDVDDLTAVILAWGPCP